MTSNISKGDYVRIRDLAGHPHIGIVDFFSDDKSWVGVKLLTGLWCHRLVKKVEKLTRGESMLVKLENA